MGGEIWADLLASQRQGENQHQLGVGDSHAPGLVSVSISIHLRGGEGGHAGAHHGHVVLHKEEAQVLA